MQISFENTKPWIGIHMYFIIQQIDPYRSSFFSVIFCKIESGNFWLTLVIVDRQELILFNPYIWDYFYYTESSNFNQL